MGSVDVNVHACDLDMLWKFGVGPSELPALSSSVVLVGHLGLVIHVDTDQQLDLQGNSQHSGAKARCRSTWRTTVLKTKDFSQQKHDDLPLEVCKCI